MKRLFERHEAEVAGLLPRGRKTIASGSKYEKSDVVRLGAWGLLVECKSTQSAGFRVTRSLWKLARDRAYNRSVDLRPALAIRFYGPTKTIETTKVIHDLVIIDLEDFTELIHEIDALRAVKNGTELARTIEQNDLETQQE